MANMYNRGKYQTFQAMLAGASAADLRALLVTDAYTYDPDHNVVNDVVAQELTVSNYARQALTSEAVTENDTADRAQLDAADVTFSSLGAGETIGGAIIFNFVTNDTDSWLLCFIDTNDLATAGNNVTLQFGSTGFLHLLEV